MAEREIPPFVIDMLGYAREDVLALTQKQRDMLCSINDLNGYKMVAEVVKAENCTYQPSIGDRYVFAGGGSFLQEECSWPVCAFAISPMLPFLYMYYDRIRAGLDPNDMWTENIKCSDTGVQCGGFGEVLFRIKFEKLNEAEQMIVLQNLMK